MELAYSLFFYVYKPLRFWKLNCEVSVFPKFFKQTEKIDLFLKVWKYPVKEPKPRAILGQHIPFISWLLRYYLPSPNEFYYFYFPSFHFIQIEICCPYSDLFFVCYILLAFSHSVISWILLPSFFSWLDTLRKRSFVVLLFVCLVFLCMSILPPHHTILNGWRVEGMPKVDS